MADPLHPDVALLSKLGSILVHVQEFNETGGHHFDKVSFEQLMKDQEVADWIAQMDKMALLPKKRSDR